MHTTGRGRFSSSDQGKVGYVMASSPEADSGENPDPYLLHEYRVPGGVRSAVRGWSLREIS